MKLSIFSMVLLFLLNACVYNDLPIPENIMNITYTNYTKKIVSINCLPCHVPGYDLNGAPAGGRDFTTYLEVKKAVDEGHFKLHVIDGVPPTMPFELPQLPQDVKDTLTFWINQGARE